MKPQRTWIGAFACALLVSNSPAEPTKPTQDRRTLYVDAVALFEGEEIPGLRELALEHGRYTYLFASEESRAEFQASPERYEIQMGGACARMGPLSGEGSTKIHTVYKGRLYIFASEACRTGFLEAPERLIGSDDAVPVSTPESLAAGRALLELVLEGVGGAKRVDSLTSYREELRDRVPHDGELHETLSSLRISFPDGARLESKWGDWGRGTVVLRGDAFFDTENGPEPLHSAQRREVERALHHNLLGILRARGEESFVATAVGSTAIRGVDVDLLQVYVRGTSTTLGVDPEDGRVIYAAFRGRGPSAALGRVERFFSDFRDVGGLRLPWRVETRFEGEEFAGETRTWTMVAVNERFAPALFARPGVLRAESR